MNEFAVDKTALTIPVDSEHGALRLSVIAIFLLAGGAAFALANALIPSEGLNIIAILAALAAAGILARLGEQFLKTRWPSGRAVQVDGRGVRILAKGAVQQEVHTGQHTNVLLWRFKNKRRNRVPKGWFVVACALEQDNRYLAVYAFASPEQADALNKNARFATLVSEQDANARDARADSLRAAGEQRRLRTAEAHRWQSGAEMSLAEFEQFLDSLYGQFGQWMPLNR